MPTIIRRQKSSTPRNSSSSKIFGIVHKLSNRLVYCPYTVLTVPSRVPRFTTLLYSYRRLSVYICINDIIVQYNVSRLIYRGPRRRRLPRRERSRNNWSCSRLFGFARISDGEKPKRSYLYRYKSDSASGLIRTLKITIIITPLIYIYIYRVRP